MAYSLSVDQRGCGAGGKPAQCVHTGVDQTRNFPRAGRACGTLHSVLFGKRQFGGKRQIGSGFHVCSIITP
jgi:hypothetical protein